MKKKLIPLITETFNKYFVIKKDGNLAKGNAQNVAKYIVDSFNMAGNEHKKAGLLKSYRGMLLGIKTRKGLAIKKSPVACWSYVSRNAKISKGMVLYECDTSPEYGRPLIACAPHSEYLTNFLEQNTLLNYTLGGIKISTSNCSFETEALSRDRFKCSFTAHTEIKPGEILAQDYVSLVNHELQVGPYKFIDVPVLFDWVKSGATPSLMTVTGEPVPNIKGKIKTHFIEGIEVKGNTAKPKFTILPPNTQLNPDQKIIGDVGTTLYAYDERLHLKFAKTFGSLITALPVDYEQFFYNTEIANVIYPPMLLEQTIDKKTKKQINVTAAIKKPKKGRGKKDKTPLKP